MTTFAIAFGTFVLGTFLGFFIAALLASAHRDDEEEYGENWDV